MRPRGWTAIATSLALAMPAVGVSACSSPTPPPSASATPTDWDLSDSALREAYADFVRGLQKQYRLDEPVAPQLVRFVGIQEWAVVQADCLAEAGFRVEPNPQGGITWGDIPPEQAGAQRLAAAGCGARYPIDPRMNLQLPLSRADKQYDFLVEIQLPCVEAAGYAVSAPPSRQT